MANPQKEDGFTAIANEIMEALYGTKLSGHEMRLILLVLRKTYGYHKKEDAISLSQMSDLTGIHHIRCSQVIKRLQLAKILTVSENINGVRKKYIFNKDFDQWDTVSENANRYRKVKSTLSEKSNLPLVKKASTKETLTKDKLQKIKTFSSDSHEIRLSELLYGKILQRDPLCKMPNFQAWANSIDLLIRKDERPLNEIEKLICWCQEDSFWQQNILSTSKLREKYTQLKLRMEANGNGRQGSTGSAGTPIKKAGRAESDGAAWPSDLEA